MALDVVDPYQDWTVTYPLGTEDSGNGAALPPPTPGLATWKQRAAPPNGWTQSPVGAWAHGGYVYFVYDGTDGPGKGIYQFITDANGNLTYNDFVSQAALGLVAGNWANPPCFYNSGDGSVILITYPTSGANNTPIAGKWPMSAWPFTNANHTWQSALSQSYGFYVAGKVTDCPQPYLGSTYLFIASNASGQVHTIDPSDGSVVGTWAFKGSYATNYYFHLLGENAAGQPIGGCYHAAGGNANIYSWDISNLSAWATDTLLLSSSLTTAAYTPTYKRARNRLYPSNNNHTIPVSKHEVESLGLAGCMYWQDVRQPIRASECYLVHYDPDTGAFRECLTANGSTRRSIGNRAMHTGRSLDLSQFVIINGIPWFISWNEAAQDQEGESPGGDLDYHYGICLIAVGPGVVKYTKTAVAAGTPKRTQPTIAAGAKNYLCSESYQKHGVRFQNVTQTTGWSDLRHGEQELSALDQSVNGKGAWGAWNGGDELEVEHYVYAGWPQAVDETVYQNPGEVGDPTQLPTSTADVGPPREVRLMLFVEADSLPDEGKTFGKAGGGRAIDMRPGGGVATVV